MLDKAGAIPTIMTRLKKLLPGHGLDLRTFKRDRSVVIRRTGEDAFSITENGFETATFSENIKGMKKLLKTLLKREFPRSNKIRVYHLNAETSDKLD